MSNDTHETRRSRYPLVVSKASLLGLDKEETLRLVGEFRSFRIPVPTGTGTLTDAPDPGKPGVFLVYDYIDA